MFDTRVKAMNRLKKAKEELDKAELEDWYILATIDRVGDRYELIAQIKEIV
jgi:DNA integrity scanning protein DisA with diadenylate cyclase activity